MTIGRTEQTTAVALCTMAAFQIALAVGAPWGTAAYGGTRPGTLPLHLRAISGLAGLGYGAGALLIVRGAGSVQARGRAFTTLSAWMTIGTIVNAASPSPVERAVWTPVTAATTVLAWRSRARLRDLSPTARAAQAPRATAPQVSAPLRHARRHGHHMGDRTPG